MLSFLRQAWLLKKWLYFDLLLIGWVGVSDCRGGACQDRHLALVPNRGCIYHWIGRRFMKLQLAALWSSYVFCFHVSLIFYCLRTCTGMSMSTHRLLYVSWSILQAIRTVWIPHLVRIGQETTLQDVGWLYRWALTLIESVKSKSDSRSVCILRHRPQSLHLRLFLLRLQFTVFNWCLTHGRFGFRVNMNVFLSGFGRGRSICSDALVPLSHTIKCCILVSLQNSFIKFYLVRVIQIWSTSAVVHMNIWW